MRGIDTDLFLFLNFDGGLVFDRIMWVFSSKLVWIPLYALLLGIIWYKFGWRYALLVLVAVGVGVAASDQICNFFKHNFQILRPNRVAEIRDMVHSVIDPSNGEYYIGGRYGTISAHAATTMTIYLVIGNVLKNKWYWVLMPLWVLSVCYSRIYLGVHFPSQILFGLVVGAIVALIINRFVTKYFERFRRTSSAT